jgi:hypothetical protein
MASSSSRSTSRRTHGEGNFDSVIVTDLLAAGKTFKAVVVRVGLDRVLAPKLLRARLRMVERATA